MPTNVLYGQVLEKLRNYPKNHEGRLFIQFQIIFK